MDQVSLCNRIGNQHKTSNIEGGEYSYVQVAGSREKLNELVGYKPKHFKLDIRFQCGDVVVLVETKQRYKSSDQKQLKEYLLEEEKVNLTKKVICILADTSDDQIKVWKGGIGDEYLLPNENVIQSMEYYVSLFETKRQNNREIVLRNTYSLNETLHRKDIDEKLRSQFVGTALLYIRKEVNDRGITEINRKARETLRSYWGG